MGFAGHNISAQAARVKGAVMRWISIVVGSVTLL
jgi:hypothetical protein